MDLLKRIGWTLLEILLFSMAFVVLILLQGYLLKWITGNAGIWDVSDLSENTNPFTVLYSFLPVLLSGIMASYLVYTLIMKHPFADLGYHASGKLSSFGKGVLFSFALIAPATVILLLFGQLKWLPVTFNFLYIIGFFIFFFIQSTAEEVMTRSFLISSVENRMGTGTAVFLSGSLFALMHIANDHFSFMGFLNILLGGTLMALMFVRYRSIWLTAGFHTGWNFIQGTLFDYNVSGVDVYSVMQWEPVGYDRLTGYKFGYEGSIFSVLFLSIALIWWIKRYGWPSFEIPPKPATPFPQEGIASFYSVDPDSSEEKSQ